MPSGEEIVNNEDGDLVIQRSLVSYLDGISQGMASGFADMKASLRNKADKSDLTRIETRLEEHGRAISDLQNWKHDREVAAGVHTQRDERSRLSFKGKIAVGAGALSLASTIALAVASFIH